MFEELEPTFRITAKGRAVLDVEEALNGLLVEQRNELAELLAEIPYRLRIPTDRFTAAHLFVDALLILGLIPDPRREDEP